MKRQNSSNRKVAEIFPKPGDKGVYKKGISPHQNYHNCDTDRVTLSQIRHGMPCTEADPLMSPHLIKFGHLAYVEGCGKSACCPIKV